AGIKGALSLGDSAGALFAGPRWLIAALAAGVLPLLVAAPFGSPLHQPVTALLAFALVVGAVHAGRTLRGLAAVAVVFVAHCAAAIVLARVAPGSAAPMLPGGPEYWAQTHT